jgi:RNA polymerase-binding transcription factor DksA
MAKHKKSTSKSVKKAPAKAKKAAKTRKATPVKAKKVKKVSAKKAPAKAPVKKAPTKKTVAKKAAPKKAAVKKAVAPKKQAKSAPKVAKQKAKPVVTKKVATREVTPEVQKRVTPLKPAVVVQKPAPPQLNIFPVPNQRPIAHKPQNAPAHDDRTKYSEEELVEFESLINKKLAKARDEYKILKETLNRNNDEGTDATSGGNTKVLEDGAETAEKENLSQLAARQQKYIMNLENALVRIKNGTYGICSVTGKLIPKERLIAVPHTTQSIEAKMMQQD